MVLELPDTVKDKLAYIHVELVKYALTLYPTRTQAAMYIGISIRTLRNWIKEYPELSIYKNVPQETVEGNDMWDRYEDSPLWKTKKIEGDL